MLASSVSLLGATPEEAAEQLRQNGVTVRGNLEKGWYVVFPRKDDRPATKAELELVTQLQNVGTLQLSAVADEDLAVLAPIAEGVKRFSISNDSVSDATIAQVAMFRNVQHFGMRSDAKEPAITPEGMRQLQGFSQVESLGVGGHSFPPEALALLPELFPDASSVDFNHTFKVNADVFTAFQKFNDLQKLNLGGCYKTDEAGMRAIGGLEDLQELSVFHAGAYQWAAIESLKGHPSLRDLRVGDGRPGHDLERRVINDNDMEILLSIPTLESFSTGGDPNGGLTDAAGEILARHPNLKSLNLGRKEFTDAILTSLKQAPALEQLTLNFENLTPQGLAELQEFPKLKKLQLGHSRFGVPIEGTDLAALQGIPGIEEIDVRMDADSNPGEQSIEALKAAYPDAKVEVRYGSDHRR